jgi:hypothetical protein
MDSTWYAAFGLLCVLTLVNSALVLGMLRQVGVLHQRLPPTGPGTHEGPGIGQRFAIPEDAAPINKGAASLAGLFDPHRITLLAYVTPGCGLCDDLLPALSAYGRSAPADRIQLAAVTDVAIGDAKEYVRAKAVRLPAFHVPGLGRTYGLPGSPYVLAVRAEEGQLRVLGGGVANTLEQIEDIEKIAEENVHAIDAQRHPDGLPLVVAGNGHQPAHEISEVGNA